VFVVEIVLSSAKQCSLSKLCCLQRSSVRCRNYVVCSASEFAAKIGLCAAKQCSLRNCVVYSESVFIAEIVLSAVTSVHCRNVLSTANQCSLPKL
jgi:hypothetical protein